MSDQVDRSLRDLAHSDLECAMLGLYFDGSLALVVRNGRHPGLERALGRKIRQMRLASGAADEPGQPEIRFVRIGGYAARNIALTRQDRSSPLAWLRRGLKSGVFTGKLRGIGGVIIDRIGERLVFAGQTRELLLMLSAGCEALRVLKSRSKRGLLRGPYWYMATGPAVDQLLPRGEQPSALARLFPTESDNPGRDEGATLATLSDPVVAK